MFFRWRTIRGRRYLYSEVRWREGKKVRSRSRIVRMAQQTSFDVSGNLGVAAALPFMIAGDLISGNRLAELQQFLDRSPSPDKKEVERQESLKHLYDKYGLWTFSKPQGEVEKWNIDGVAKEHIPYSWGKERGYLTTAEREEWAKFSPSTAKEPGKAETEAKAESAPGADPVSEDTDGIM